MIGMRNRVAHGSDDVDPELMWRVGREDIVPVIAGQERALARG